MRAYWRPFVLASSNQSNHFQAIRLAQLVFRVPGARHQFEVHFHGYVPRGQLQLAKQRGDGNALGHFAGRAINQNIQG